MSKRIEELEGMKKKLHPIKSLEIIQVLAKLEERKLAEKDFKKLELFRDNEIIAIKLEDWEKELGKQEGGE